MLLLFGRSISIDLIVDANKRLLALTFESTLQGLILVVIYSTLIHTYTFFMYCKGIFETYDLPLKLLNTDQLPNQLSNQFSQ